jgi:A/G-specific adenine glycosylase
VTTLSSKILSWYDRHGRHVLPWQRPRSAYGVWVAEIMLQQTQVATVIPYYQRFMQRFATTDALAAVEIDRVLHLWSGLGYYARARNLPRADRFVCADHHGEVPDDFAALVALPGIGRSTAGAILATAFGQRHPILDGNVKRVLSRVSMLDEWPGSSGAQKKLWALAENHTPSKRVADYTQAIMDIGATVCTRANPDCARCPITAECQAFQHGRQDQLPVPRPARQKPKKAICFLIATRRDGAMLLERRPPTGIWGGLWSFPEIDDATRATEWCQRYGMRARSRARKLDPITHTFTHFQLQITPLQISVDETDTVLMDSDRWLWYNVDDPAEVGLARPVTRLFKAIPNA